MILRFFFILFFAFTATTLYSQDVINTHIDSIKTYRDKNKRIEAYQYLLQQRDTLSQTQSLGTLFHELGTTYYFSKDYEKAFYYISKAIPIRDSYKEKQLSLLNESRYRLALIHKKQGDVEKQQQLFLDIIADEGSDNYTHLSYRYLANHEIKKGDIYKAIYFLNIGLANKELCKTVAYELKIRIALIVAYSKMYQSVFDASNNNSDLAIIRKHQQKIEESFLNVDVKEEKLYATYNNLANIYKSFKDWDGALLLYEKSKDFYEAKSDTQRVYTTISNMAIMYSQKGKHTKASNYFKKVIEESNDQELIASAYNNLGYFSPAISAISRISSSQNAIQIILGKEDTPFTLPSLEEIQDSAYEQDILIYLIDLANHYTQAYKEEGNKSYLFKAQSTLYNIDQLVSLIRHQSTSEQSKLFWIEKGVNVYMLAVEVSYLLGNPDDVFYFMEKNKALLLQENIRTLQGKLELDIPKNILEREYSLYYKRLNAFKKNQEFPDDIQAGNQFTHHHKNYMMFMDSLKRKYPEYAKIKKETKVSNLKEVIKTNNCFIEYILNENAGYGLFHLDGETIVFEIPEVIVLQDELKLLKQYFTTPILTSEEKRELHQYSFSVFKKLFPFQNALAKLKGRNVTIILDHNLQTFPLEALSVTKDGDLSESYLIHHSEVSYLQSFSVFEHIKQSYTDVATKLLFVAPEQFEDPDLIELTGAKAFIDNLSIYDDISILHQEEATAANFLKNHANAEVIHLNTHASIDTITQVPWIAFRDQKMSLYDLYGVKNQAELIVLDACKTNTGKIEFGEGIISLSRGFFYNGSQSVLASLWNVNEKSSTTLLNHFYKEIEKGATKSKALQTAKIKYLEEHQFSETLPYYWAAFTLTGSTKPILLTPKTSVYTYVYIFMFIVLISLFIVYVKRRNTITKVSNS